MTDSLLGWTITIPLPDVDQDLTDGWVSVRVYTATSENGAYSLATTISLVAGQTAYTYNNTAGAATDWVYHVLYNGVSEGTPSPVYPVSSAPVLTLGTLRQRVADELTLYGRPKRNSTWPGPSGTTTAAGSTTTTVCSAFISARWATEEFIDWCLLATSGTEDGNWRLVSSFAGGSGTFTHDAFASGVGSGQTFELYGKLTPEEWIACINEQLLDMWLPVRYPIGGLSGQTEYPLPAFFEDEEQILGLATRSGTTLSQHRFAGGVEFLTQPQEGGGVVLYFDISALGANEVAILEGYRHPAKLFDAADTITLSEQNQRILVIGAAQKAAERLAVAVGGLAEDRAAWERRAAKLEARRRVLVAEKGGMWNRTRTVRQDPMVAAGGRWRWSGRSRYY